MSNENMEDFFVVFGANEIDGMLLWQTAVCTDKVSAEKQTSLFESAHMVSVGCWHPRTDSSAVGPNCLKAIMQPGVSNKKGVFDIIQTLWLVNHSRKAATRTFEGLGADISPLVQRNSVFVPSRSYKIVIVDSGTWIPATLIAITESLAAARDAEDVLGDTESDHHRVDGIRKWHIMTERSNQTFDV